MFTFFITQSETGMRLDKFLMAKFPENSRALIKEKIKASAVLINKKNAKPSLILRQGDCVVLMPSFASPENQKIQPNSKIKLPIIYEDKNIIVIDKPDGISVHPRQDKNNCPLQKEINNTIASALLARYPEIANVGDNPLLRPGIVHRLDKDTSGILIAAKNQKSFEWFKKQFKERKTEKKYLALVAGIPKQNSGIIDTLIVKSKSDPTKQKIIKKETASPDVKTKEAITKYSVIKTYDKFSLLEAIPKTGRMHQIRAHFAWIGCPVAGDKKYGKNTASLKGLTRHFLHAASLKITMPNGQEKIFESPLPPDLAQIIQTLEKNQD